MEKTFGKQLVEALAHVGYTLLYFLILLPYFIWKKATINLSVARQNNVLKYEKIGSPWPFLSYLKRITFDFTFDFVIFILPALGLIAAIIMAISEKSFIVFLIVLIGTYYSLPGQILLKDILQLTLIAPIRKYLSWIKKPAQHVDLTMDKELK